MEQERLQYELNKKQKVLKMGACVADKIRAKKGTKTCAAGQLRTKNSNITIPQALQHH